MRHSGMDRTTNRIRLSWHWPRMTSDVREAIHACEVCQMTKNEGLHPAGGRRRLFARRAWQRLGVDLVDPLPETERGNRWKLLSVDHSTRWQDAIAINGAATSSVARTIDVRILCYFGIPEVIHSDHGAQLSQLRWRSCMTCGDFHIHTPLPTIPRLMGW